MVTDPMASVEGNKPIQVRVKAKEDKRALERVRKRDGDRDWTATFIRLVHESDTGGCQRDRGDGRICGATVKYGDAACVGCIFDRGLWRKRAK